MDSRVSRLHDKSRIGVPRQPTLDLEQEISTLIAFAVLLAAIGGVSAAVLFNEFAEKESTLELALGLAPGIVMVGALASSFTFLVLLGHRLLLLAAALAFVTAGALMLGLTPLESVAKTLCAVSIGLWIGLMLTSIIQVLLISLLIIFVDFYSVFFGPTKKLVEGGSPLVGYVTISLPVFGIEAASRLGSSDIIFFSLFVATTLVYGLRRRATAIALTLSIVGTMLIGVTLDYGVPALPLMSVFFLLVNGDLLYRRFLDEPDEMRKRSPALPGREKKS